ncbi:hypothetical protein [Sphingobacterium sp. HMA12]|uniref:hypothetical protein n=1 Tax=Sphingobacterium sp. HMA12 TaxID=2050894 RepID=UPI000CEA4A92|nr:hypothetical protein [Sphingobacterium sp. HMA12]
MLAWIDKLIYLLLVIGAFLAPLLLHLDQGFQFIQEFTGFITPELSPRLLIPCYSRIFGWVKAHL